MSKRFGLLRPVVAVLLALFLLCQGTWALAGTTGTLSGTVTDEKGAPVAGATVTVSSPSQTVSTTSQSNGHYVFLSLAPDTYTIAVNKEGAIQPYSQGGIAVFADQTQTQDLRVASVNLKEIARVTSRAANDLVKAGTTSDIYSVNAATAEKVGAIGGGTNLNSAYSALASQPGVLVGYGGIGWGQQIFIHGASYSQVGYELDGVPVNRAFDNYNANSLSNLGQQELQIVTSGAPSNSSSQTVGGFINQVIRTGTYPGFGTVNAGIAGPTYYHQMKAEAGGAMPNRLFSYYVGFLGSNQDYKPYDNFMGGTGIPGLTPIMSGLQTNTGQTAGMFPFCVASPGGPGAQIGIADVPANQLNPAIFPAGTAPGCEAGPFPAALGSTSSYTDREAVANFHIGIPHHNDSGRDDVQILYDGSYQNNAFYSSINDHGGIQTYCGMLQGLTTFEAPFVGATSPISFCPTNPGYVNNAPGINYNPNGFYVPYADATIFGNSVQFGQIAQAGLPTQPYFFPSSPTNRQFLGPQPVNARDGINNDAQIVKVQYQKNIGANQYVRIYGYTFFSDWLQNAPQYAQSVYKFGSFVETASTPDYELITHTRGGEVQYANQLNPQNLLNFTLNYTTASVSRFNNGTFRNAADGSSASTNLGIISGPNIGTCYDFATGAQDSCLNGGTRGSFANPSQGQIPCGQAGSTTPAAACAAGANWYVTFAGPRGTLNQVSPAFTSISLTDQSRPNDKLLINAGLREDNFKYSLQASNSQGYNFWFTSAANSFCYDPAAANGVVFFTQPALGAIAGGTPPFSGLTCPASTINGCTTLHPNGQAQTVTCPGQAPTQVTAKLYSNFSNPSYTVSKFEPRLSATYTLNPDAVLRFAAGEYVNPFNTATVQYLDAAPQRAAIFDYQSFWGVGFTTPEHDVRPSTSTNVDLSWEQRMKGTDWTFKFSPYYRYVTNQTQDSFIGPGFVSAIPTNNETAYGVEFQINKGDPNKDGLSGQLSYTYTHATSKMIALGNGQNLIDNINAQVAAYNALTASGSGTSYSLSTGQTTKLGTAAPCYVGGAAAGTGPTGAFANPTYCTSNGSGNTTSCVTVSATGLANGAIVNPYYCQPAQPYYNPSGSYPMYQTFPNPYEDVNYPDINGTLVWPNILAGWVNYKHDRFSIAPSFQLIEGAQVGPNGGGQYGNPLSVVGLDPRTCAANQANVPGAANPGWANYLSCAASQNALGAFFIPNPYTGHFDNFGQYQNPWILNFNALLTYDVSPRVKATLTLANIYNTCFAGTPAAWTAANPPGHNGVCIYAPNGFTNGWFVGTQPGAGFFLGNSPSASINPAPYNNNVLYPYSPAGGFLPFEAYLQVQVKI